MSYRGDRTTGFESPAQDYIEEAIDLAELLELRRPHQWAVRVIGQALRDRGIQDGDILVIDSAADAAPNRVCVAMINGDVILATLRKVGDTWQLRPASGLPIEIKGDDEIFGLVRSLVRARV